MAHDRPSAARRSLPHALRALAVLAALAVPPPQATAQARADFGVAVTVPVGDFADVADAGWLGHGAFHVSPWDVPLEAGLIAFWGRNGHEPPPTGDRSDVHGALARLLYRHDTGALLTPYVGGMAGVLTRRFRSETQPGLNASRTRFAVGAAAGVHVPVRSVVPFLEGWLLSDLTDADTTRVAGISIGVGFQIGGI
jgi:hypothetical protein